jgi:predicted alpha-1,2-mannosidase
VVLAEAHAKGVKGIDYAGAWAAFRKVAFESDVHGLPEYRARGWIPSDQVDEAASRTLEYSYDDWAMAALADAAGDAESARALRARSRNYAHLFDKASTFIRPRLSNGDWATPFDPRALGHDTKKWRDFTECNAWEATFLNQHDLYAYMALFGGEKAFEAKLDTLFNMSSDLPADAPPDIAGMVGQYAHGNEPSHHVAYLYAYAGAPYKTQARVRQILTTLYAAAPDGLAGNEDCGQMSAWYVMSALGFYPVDPVSAVYVLGSPLFDRATIDVGEGRTFTVEAPGNAPDAPYIRSATLNGRPYERSWISHADIMRGGHLVLRMGRTPNTAFGRALIHRPPSFV